MSYLNFIKYILIISTLVSCLDELPREGNLNFCPGQRDGDGICLTSSSTKIGWSSLSASQFSYDTNYIEITNGKANLKEIDTRFLGSDFNNGSHLGTYFDSSSNKLSFKTKSNKNLNVKEIFPDKVSSLLAYFPFENSIEDQSGKNLSVTTYSGVGYSTESLVGEYSYKKDTSKQYGAVVTDFPNLGRNFTISMWVNQSSFNSYRRVLLKGLDNTTNDFRIESDNTNLYSFEMYKSSGGWCGTGDVISFVNDSWQHLLVTHDGATIRTYLNGNLIDESNCAGDIRNTGQKLTMGNRLEGYSSFDGLIDELSVWNETLDTDEISKLYNTQAQNYTELNSVNSPNWDDLVFYWKMEGNWQDTSTNANHGSATGGVSFSSDSKVSRTSGSFDGVDDYVSSPTIAQAMSSFSISGWFKADSTTSNMQKILLSDPGGSEILQLRIYPSNDLVLETADSSGSNVAVRSSSGIRDDKWHHFFIVRNSSEQTLKIYIDGVLNESKSDTRGSFNFGASIRLSFDWGSEFFKGYLDDFAMWSKALSTSEVEFIYNFQKQKYSSYYLSPVIDMGSLESLTSLKTTTEQPFLKEISGASDYSSVSGDLSNSLMAYFNMNEGSGTTLNDQSGALSPINATLNSASFLSNGHLGGGVSISNWGQWIETPSINLGSLFTISMWAKIDSNSTTTNYLFSNKTGGSSVDGFSFFINNWNTDDRMIQLNTGNGTNFLSAESPIGSAPLSDGKWHHYLISINKTAGQAHIYIDGAKVNSASTSIRTDFSSTGIMYIGANADNGAALNGNIDEVGIWNRQLNASEIEELYRRGANRVKYQVRKCQDLTCSNNPDWIGPGGEASTYFSELYNKSYSNLSLMFNSCFSVVPDVCDNSEFDFVGNVLSTQPNHNFLELPVRALETRYFQYRVIMEADDNSACSGKLCLPSVSEIDINTASTYYRSAPSIVSTTPIVISEKVSKVVEDIDGNCSIKYQFSKNGTDFFYLNSNTWVSAANDKNFSNSADEVSLELKNFITTGNLYVRAYFISDGNQSCELNSLTFK